METPTRRFARLATALDELVAQEAATIATRDYAAVKTIQDRAGPVVAALSELGIDVADEVARARVASLLSRRQHTLELLESQLATARAELQASRESAGRIARIAPVYGRAGAGFGAGRFAAAG